MRAVIIDDEKHGVITLQKLLQNYCPEVEVSGVASNARDGRRLIEQVQPECVFLDVAMPGKSGLDLLQEIDRINFKIIFVTAHHHYILQALRLSAIDYLLQPVNEDELIKAVEKAKTANYQETVRLRLQTMLENNGARQAQELKITLPVGLWKWCAVILAVAVVGKFTGSAVAARFVGLSLKESLMVGALMNTRGLMELVVLNIGYDLGVISPEIFAMMVIMALVTTVMTGPTLTLIERLFPTAARPAQAVAEEAKRFRILVPFGDPGRGRNMVLVAHAFLKRNDNASVVALHLTPSSDVNTFNLAERERDSFKPILKEKREKGIPLETHHLHLLWQWHVTC